MLTPMRTGDRVMRLPRSFVAAFIVAAFINDEFAAREKAAH